MVTERIFLFHGQPRWNLGWVTPNYAGAFVVTFLCLLWAMPWKGRGRALGVAMEAGLCYLLCKTYSRGALTGLLVAAGFFGVAIGWNRWIGSWRIWTTRAGLIGACLLGTGFIGRWRPGALAADGAVTHRLALWRGGAEMVAMAPWSGWGAGESGRAYMNWFQSVDRPERFTTMVNSYLHVAVEHGLPVFSAAVAALSAVLIAAGAMGRNNNPRSTDERLSAGRTAAAAGASLMAWAVANVFTTLWIEPKLWILPAVAAGIVLAAVRRSSRPIWRRAGAGGAMAGGAAAVLLWVVGKVWTEKSRWRIEPREPGTVRMADPAGAAWKTAWNIWTDTEVLGRTPGKEIRRWLAASPATACLVVHGAGPVWREPGDAGSVESTGQGLMLFGRQAERLGRDLSWTGEIVLVHPSGSPPVDGDGAEAPVRRHILVVLPEIDQHGDQPRWRAWAKVHGARVIAARGVGQDIRAAWPAVLPFPGLDRARSDPGAETKAGSLRQPRPIIPGPHAAAAGLRATQRNRDRSRTPR